MYLDEIILENASLGVLFRPLDARNSSWLKTSRFEFLKGRGLTCCRQASHGKEAEDGQPKRAIRLNDTEDGVLVKELVEGTHLPQHAKHDEV